MEPSGADKGFFQEAPVLPNQFLADVALRRAFKLFLPRDVAAKAGPEITNLGDEVLSDQIFNWVTDSERNKPYIKGNGRDAFGKWKGELVVGEGWRRLQEFGIAKGMVATGYENRYGVYSRVVQFLRLHIWTPSSSMVTCPSAMHDGASRLLQLHLAKSDLDVQRRKIFQNAFDHLQSRDPAEAWTSGQWMTERTGGSDVSLTETVAAYNPNINGLADAKDGTPLGPWSISGFKWFSSATDSNMTVLLARTPKGLSAFLAPMRRVTESATSMVGKRLGSDGTELNGVRIQRLKNKFGTQSLPTAELELQGMRAWLIGEEGKGIQEISTVLTITRIYSAVAAVGYLGRGLLIAREYAKIRSVGAGQGKRMLLSESPLHMRTLSNMTAEYHGLLNLAIFSAYLLGLSEHPSASFPQTPPPRTAALRKLTPKPQHITPLLRVLTQLTKAYVCKSAIPLLYACMESLGGLGYLLNEEQEYLNIARLYRDCCVLAIWEGTTDVLSTDFIRAVKHPRGGTACIEALDTFIRSNVGSRDSEVGGWRPLEAWENVMERLGTESQEELMGDARGVVWVVAEALITVLLDVDRGCDGSEVVGEVLERFVALKGLGGKGKASLGTKTGRGSLKKDQAIVYGEEGVSTQAKL